jgi:hypothetical protein
MTWLIVGNCYFGCGPWFKNSFTTGPILESVLWYPVHLKLEIETISKML